MSSKAIDTKVSSISVHEVNNYDVSEYSLKDGYKGCCNAGQCFVKHAIIRLDVYEFVGCEHAYHSHCKLDPCLLFLIDASEGQVDTVANVQPSGEGVIDHMAFCHLFLQGPFPSHVEKYSQAHFEHDHHLDESLTVFLSFLLHDFLPD